MMTASRKNDSRRAEFGGALEAFERRGSVADDGIGPSETHEQHSRKGWRDAWISGIKSARYTDWGRIPNANGGRVVVCISLKGKESNWGRMRVEQNERMRGLR